MNIDNSISEAKLHTAGIWYIILFHSDRLSDKKFALTWWVCLKLDLLLLSLKPFDKYCMVDL